MANPLLVDVELLYPQDAVVALTQHRHKQYYDGSEIVVAGRIADHKLGSFKADVRARGVIYGQWWVGREEGNGAARFSTLLPSQPIPRALSFP